MTISDLKPTGIPLFVTAYAAILAAIGVFLGISALIDPSSAVGYVEGGDMIAGAWAGRTLGMALLTALALWFRNAQVYTLVFLGSVCREGGDVVGALNSGSSGIVAVLLAFLALDLAGLFFSGRALAQSSAA